AASSASRFFGELSLSQRVCSGLWFVNNPLGGQSPAFQRDSRSLVTRKSAGSGQVTMLQSLISPNFSPLNVGREVVDLPDSEAGWIFGEPQVVLAPGSTTLTVPPESVVGVGAPIDRAAQRVRLGHLLHLARGKHAQENDRLVEALDQSS